jgi:hypothetical protein
MAIRRLTPSGTRLIRTAHSSHPLFTVNRNPSPELDPSSEFESEKTKLVLRSCFLFLYTVKLRIPTARHPVGIQI